MRGLSLVILTLLVGCAGEEPAPDPYSLCQQQGLPADSPAFASCLRAAIVAQCAAAGDPAGSLAHELCLRRLRDHAAITRELERRAAWPGFDQLLGN